MKVNTHLLIVFSLFQYFSCAASFNDFSELLKQAVPSQRSIIFNYLDQDSD